MFPNKKAMDQMWWIIMSAVLVILVVIFILIWFKGSGEKAFGFLGGEIGGLSDCDGDYAKDLSDDCPCDPSLQDLQEGEKCSPSGAAAKEKCPGKCP